ncbi:hypothetical protein KAZ92_00100 [Candidatus Gracilibacteria bacterium]|nr:hypothetical protein [Candidatus Gracilibacteria bacterium]
MGSLGNWLRQRRIRKEHHRTLGLLFKKLVDPMYLPSHAELEMLSDDSDRWIRFLTHDIHRPIYELWSREVVDTLAQYICDRFSDASVESPVRILEVGAGDGRLAHFLQLKLRELRPDAFQMFATDSGAFEYKPLVHVEKMSAKDAVVFYEPQLVIASWMPANQDWTGDFERALSVQEFILIGPEVDRKHTRTSNFNAQPLDEVTHWLISRMTPTKENLSKAVSYRRKDVSI